MCKPTLIPIRRTALACASALLGLSTLLLPVQTVEASCAVGEGGTLGVDNLGPVHIGDTITVTTVELANLLTSFQATNFNTFVVFPNNTPEQAMSVSAIPPGTSCQAGGAPFDETCPGGSDCLSFVNTYVVSFADVGRNLTFSRTVGGFTAVCNAAGVPGNIQFEEAGAGAALTGTGGTGTPVGAASLCQTILIPVIFPCISITKECDTNCTPYGQPIFFHGTVSNTGDSALVNVVVSDTPPAGSTSSAITFENVQPSNRTWDGTLAAGESAVYHGSYTPPNNGGTSLCGPFTDTISATAVDVTGTALDNTTPCINSTTGVSTGTRPAVTATCHVSTAPAITLAKDCYKISGPGSPPVGGKVLATGDSYIETFLVANTGNVPLTGVVITDVSTKTGTSTITVGNLDVGQSVSLTNGPITVTTTDCPGVSDSAGVSGNNLCPGDTTCPASATVTNGPVTCALQVICPPQICITKAITCAPATGVAGCNSSLTYGSTATGTAGTNNPAFCYQIILSNCGADVLTNITVTDNLIPSVAGAFPTHLDIGQSVTNYFGQSYPAGTNVNTVTATGVGITSGISVTTNASATAIVVPASLTCSLNLTNDFQVNTNAVNGCDVVLASGTSNSATTVILTIHNTGSADLEVSVIGGSVLSTTPLVDCGTGASLTPPVVFVPAGQTVVTNLGCVSVSCPGATVSAVVQGTAVASLSIPCVFDTLGNVITTAPSSCQNCVSCQVATSCRVTGGGTLQPGATDTNCIPVTTTLFDDMQPAGLVLDHISHGGQLGAPFSQQDCGQILGDPCIRGQWQHNRHYQGTGSPQDQIDADFHSNTPKGVFDTLQCACLGCCSGGEFIGSAVANALCNPDDHKICGPEPRPAPANAIIFTGIGTFTPQGTGNGRAAQSRYVVFRVYIEDRSEPGGLHPGGAKQPADVYCFQAWDTGIPTSKKPDFSTVATDFRRALAADSCAFISSISTSAPTGLPPGSLPSSTVAGTSADIVDCGPLYDGNQQIHPSTGATCTTTTPLQIISP